MTAETQDQIEAFLDSPRIRAAEISTDEMYLYVRRSMRHVAGRMVRLIDIVNITVFVERQGSFKSLLRFLQDNGPDDGVFVECVHNPHLMAYLVRLSHGDVRWYLKDENCFVWLRD